ncbi:MAG: pseudouridine-5'-phosphate glycosidase [Phycisphaerales bacterium]|nr:pseudouridine-5'-phosphate glycosidase [Phycisphaerales bacterium]
MSLPGLVNRAGPGCVALETTLPVHGVPRERGRALCGQMAAVVAENGARAAFTGIVAGRPVVGMSERELDAMFGAPDVAKVNTSNLGLVMHRAGPGATTVSTMLELAAAAGLRAAATGGLGGVHKGYDRRLDVSADLAALARFPVVLVCSGVKSLLDVGSTREVLESLGVPVVGFGTDRFPAFYLRESTAGVDARFDDVTDLARFASAEAVRTGRAVVVVTPPPEPLDPAQFAEWLAEAERRAPGTGRGVTPGVLSHLHEISGGATLRANIALALSNARLAGQLCAAMKT